MILLEVRIFQFKNNTLNKGMLNIKQIHTSQLRESKWTHKLIRINELIWKFDNMDLRLSLLNDTKAFRSGKSYVLIQCFRDISTVSPGFLFEEWVYWRWIFQKFYLNVDMFSVTCLHYAVSQATSSRFFYWLQ